MYLSKVKFGFSMKQQAFKQKERCNLVSFRLFRLNVLM